MRCKPGDLAVVVAPFGELGGSLCTVERLANIGDTDSIGCINLGCDGVVWHIELARPKVLDGVVHHRVMFMDRYLRPLRDSDAEDETLTWAGKPVDVHAPIERLTPANPLPHYVGGGTLRTWPDESTAWEGIQ